MKCDFSRSTFQPGARYSRVLMQQGRVQLDADWNEQVAIGVHQLRALAADLIGEHGGPKGNGLGFGIGKGSGLKNGDFAISPGRYYVHGILCENAKESSFLSQPDLPGRTGLTSGGYLVYLDVWEREITPIQDAAIREVALGGADTAARARVVWQVRTLKAAQNIDIGDRNAVLKLFEETLARVPGRLRAQTNKGAQGNLEPCQIAPDARYRGVENQLYRVEIQSLHPTTFRWSRDNGSVVFPVVGLVTSDDKTVVRLEHLGRDQRSGLAPGDWVEIADDASALDAPDKSLLLTVLSVDRHERTVTLQGVANSDIGRDSALHPLLRRWDHSSLNKASLKENTGLAVGSSKDWIDLEDGVQVQFDSDQKATYRVGDYWLIPARTATGEVEWPRGANHEALFQEPHGVPHYYAPLATLKVGSNDELDLGVELRNAFAPLASPLQP